MDENVEKQQQLNDTIRELIDTQHANNYGLSKSFMDKNRDLITSANKSINEVLLGYGMSDHNTTYNSLKELVNVVNSSIRYTQRADKLMHADNEDPATGIRGISPVGNANLVENQLIGEHALKYQGYFSRLREYQGIVNLISPLKRAIRNMTRDILTTSDLNRKLFNSVYDPTLNKALPIETSETEKIRGNDLIRTKIIEPNNLETRLKSWTKDAIIYGVKPIACFPYEVIINQTKMLAENNHMSINENGFRSGESYSLVDKEQCKRLEEVAYERSMESAVATEHPDFDGDASLLADDIYDEIIDSTPGLLEEFASECELQFKRTGEDIQNTKDSIASDVISNQLKHDDAALMKSTESMDWIDNIQSNYNDTKKKFHSMSEDEQKKQARLGLRNLMKEIDNNIIVSKKNTSAASISNKILAHRDRYKNFYDLGKDYISPEKMNEDNVIHSGDRGGKKNRVDPNSPFTMSTKELSNKCLIVPYQPESVIPIMVNDVITGYYCLEYEYTVGDAWKNRKKANSFTDYVTQQGFGDGGDKHLLQGNGLSMAYGGADPVDINAQTPMSMYNFPIQQYLSGGDQDVDTAKKYDTMKMIVLKILSRRLHDPELVDDNTFKDAVMTMLRTDALIRNKVQFTFVPPEYMIYYTYDVDSDGMPESALSGILFYAYLYISSVISSAMIKVLKSSDKEKYEVNVGLQKNIGYSLSEMQRALSTRQVYSQSMFGSLQSVLKNTGCYQRLMIPVVDGMRLYDVQSLATNNDMSPDDSFTDKLLQYILDHVGYNAGMMNEVDNLEYAKQLDEKNIEYRDIISSAQDRIKPQIDKLIRRMTKFSDIETYNSREALPEKKDDPTYGNMIDLACIDVKLILPTSISMGNIQAVLNDAKETAASVMDALSLNDDNALTKKRNEIFKTKIIKRFCGVVDWDEITKMLEASMSEAQSQVAEDQKAVKIDEKLQNPDSDDDGGMGGDMGGGDMGGDDMF